MNPIPPSVSLHLLKLPWRLERVFRFLLLCLKEQRLTFILHMTR